MTKNTKIKIEISTLKPHPRQSEFFPELDEMVIEELAEDINQNGLHVPIEITSDGTIICGHQRVRAFLLLQEQEINAIVRKDLELQGEEAILQRFLEDNLNRRQMSKLETARCFRELKKCGTEWRSKFDIQGDMRDFLANRFGKSGKTLERWIKILESPLVIQKAFDCGHLNQSQALKFLSLDQDIQTEVVDRITEGEHAAEVLSEYLVDRRSRSVLIETVLRRLIKSIQDAEIEITSRIGELSARKHRHSRRKIMAGILFLQEMLSVIPEAEEFDDEAFQEFDEM